jgi:hypothetical protein
MLLEKLKADIKLYNSAYQVITLTGLVFDQIKRGFP